MARRESEYRCKASTTNYGFLCSAPAVFWVYQTKAASGVPSCAQHVAKTLKACQASTPDVNEPEFKVICLAPSDDK